MQSLHIKMKLVNHLGHTLAHFLKFLQQSTSATQWLPICTGRNHEYLRAAPASRLCSLPGRSSSTSPCCAQRRAMLRSCSAIKKLTLSSRLSRKMMPKISSISAAPSPSTAHREASGAGAPSEHDQWPPSAICHPIFLSAAKFAAAPRINP